VVALIVIAPVVKTYAEIRVVPHNKTVTLREHDRGAVCTGISTSIILDGKHALNGSQSQLAVVHDNSLRRVAHVHFDVFARAFACNQQCV
jgi:hypothetical protein